MLRSPHVTPQPDSMKDSLESFGTFHPAVTFLFFVSVIVFGMCFRHPLFLGVGLALSCLYYVIICRGRATKTLLVLLVVFAVVTLINPFLNPRGYTVLFRYFDGRPFTLESLLFGASTACMLVIMLLWFGCYNAVMTSDKFTFLFGRIIPSGSLVFTMCMRLVPSYKRKAEALSASRACIGKMSDTETYRGRITNGVNVLSALTSWALESAITTADSMRCRGYSLPGRTHYAIYRFDSRDRIMLIAEIALSAAVLSSAITGVASVSYIPSIVFAPVSPAFWLSSVAYAVLLALPSVVNIRENILWRRYLSNI